ncbi:MAG: hypothetical protein IKO57_07225 [Treponema sp.]|nr:hypothetical protein [bacterium]MBR4630217.1 hypothetical protein [Treponema sp.]
MITFKLISRNGSKNFYKFSAAGLCGIILIDIETFEIGFNKVNGFLKDNEKEKLLYIAKRKLTEMHFPESCIYATH